jgi:hypothetical protein
MKRLELGVNQCTNAEYHADKSYLSSSSLKKLLSDPEQFYKEFVLGEKKEVEQNSNFDEGSYAHSLLLEPEKIESEFRFFEGWRKAGHDWLKFEFNNRGFIILSKPQKVRIEKLVIAAKNFKPAMELLQKGLPEHTVVGELSNVPIKVRADYINIEDGYIADIKTTSYPADVESFKYTIDQYKYQLSAALYTMMFEKHYQKSFAFYFIVLSKKDTSCEVYKLSQHTLNKGKLMVLEALRKYNSCKESGNWLTDEKKSDIIDATYSILEV